MIEAEIGVVCMYVCTCTDVGSVWTSGQIATWGMDGEDGGGHADEVEWDVYGGYYL